MPKKFMSLKEFEALRKGTTLKYVIRLFLMLYGIAVTVLFIAMITR